MYLELRNRIYDFAAETQADQPRCVLPCLALAQACQRLRTEYRPICMKRKIIIDWQKVASYMRTFFPTINSRIDNIELTPSSMTVVTPWRGEKRGNELQLDILPMVKIGLYRPGFTCYFIHDDKSLERARAASSIDVYIGYILRYLRENTASLETIIDHRNVEWLSDIQTGKITRILISDIGICGQPQALFYVNTVDMGLGDNVGVESSQRTTIEAAYFESVGLLDIWPWSVGFRHFPALRRAK